MAHDELEVLIPPDTTDEGDLEQSEENRPDPSLAAIHVGRRVPVYRKLGDFNSKRVREIVHAVLSILAPQGMTEPEQAAGLVRKAAESIKKPLLASWMGGSRMQLAANVLNEARIPTFEYPDAAARSFAYMWRYSSSLQALYETPMFAGDLPEDGPRQVAEATGWPVRFAERVAETPAPTERQLNVLRELQERTAKAHAASPSPSGRGSG